MISCANKIVSRSNNILSCRNELKNKTRHVPSRISYHSDCSSIFITCSCSYYPLYKFDYYLVAMHNLEIKK